MSADGGGGLRLVGARPPGLVREKSSLSWSVMALAWGRGERRAGRGRGGVFGAERPDPRRGVFQGRRCQGHAALEGVDGYDGRDAGDVRASASSVLEPRNDSVEAVVSGAEVARPIAGAKGVLGRVGRGEVGPRGRRRREGRAQLPAWAAFWGGGT